MLNFLDSSLFRRMAFLPLPFFFTTNYLLTNLQLSLVGAHKYSHKNRMRMSLSEAAERPMRLKLALSLVTRRGITGIKMTVRELTKSFKSVEFRLLFVTIKNTSLMMVKIVLKLKICSIQWCYCVLYIYCSFVEIKRRYFQSAFH